MNRRLWIVISMIAIFLSGCTLAPKYEQPPAPVPGEWPQGEAYLDAVSRSEMATVQDLEWEAFVTDDNLKKIIAIALENNRDLQLAALNVEKSRALYGIQHAELFPAVSAVGSGVKQRRSEHLIKAGESRTVEQYSVDLGIVSWEIDFFGRIRSLEEQAMETYLATEEARRSAQIMLISEVSRVYLALAADRQKLKLSRSTLESQQASYDLIHKNFTIGLATEIDLRRAQTQVDAARRDVPHNIQLVAQDRNALNLLAGSPVPEELLPDDLQSVMPFKQISAGLSSEVLLSRPDILAAEHRLKGANAFIGAARAAFFPRIPLTTLIGTASNELSGLFESGTGTWKVAPQLVWQIFDARTWAALRYSKADQKVILTEYEKAIQTAFREVADALAVQGTINQQVEAQESLVEAAAEAYRMSNKRYTIGIDSYLSVLDAHRTLYLQQQVLITLRLAKLASQARLYAVLGGGTV